jgi:hypothetical protein
MVKLCTELRAFRFGKRTDSAAKKGQTTHKRVGGPSEAGEGVHTSEGICGSWTLWCRVVANVAAACSRWDHVRVFDGEKLILVARRIGSS